MINITWQHFTPLYILWANVYMYVMYIFMNMHVCIYKYKCKHMEYWFESNLSGKIYFGTWFWLRTVESGVFSQRSIIVWVIWVCTYLPGRKGCHFWSHTEGYLEADFPSASAPSSLALESSVSDCHYTRTQSKTHSNHFSSVEVGLASYVF